LKQVALGIHRKAIGVHGVPKRIPRRSRDVSVRASETRQNRVREHVALPHEHVTRTAVRAGIPRGMDLGVVIATSIDFCSGLGGNLGRVRTVRLEEGGAVECPLWLPVGGLALVPLEAGGNDLVPLHRAVHRDVLGDGWVVVQAARDALGASGDGWTRGRGMGGRTRAVHVSRRATQTAVLACAADRLEGVAAPVLAV
jgi:hypothetical protein